MDAIKHFLIARLGLKKRRFRHRSHHRNKKVKRCTAKVVVLGGAGVGKTSIVRAICDDCRDEQCYKPTVHEVYEKEVQLDEVLVRLELIDTAGAYPFPAMKRVFIEQADSFILVYARGDEESFKEIERLKEEICTIRGKHSTELSILVVRNKVDHKKHNRFSDLTEYRVRRNHRILSSSSAYSIPSILSWCYTAVDASARSGYNINAITEHILAEVKNKQNSPEVMRRYVSGRYLYHGLKRSQSFNNRRRLSRLASNPKCSTDI